MRIQAPIGVELHLSLGEHALFFLSNVEHVKHASENWLAQVDPARPVHVHAEVMRPSNTPEMLWRIAVDGAHFDLTETDDIAQAIKKSLFSGMVVLEFVFRYRDVLFLDPDIDWTEQREKVTVWAVEK